MPKSITFDRFDVGLDLRKGASVSDANRMRQLQNAHVTTGKVIRKRDGLTKVATLEAGTKGLVSGFGKLNTFYESGSITHANALFDAHVLAHPTTTQAIDKVHHGDVFSGYIYVSTEYADGSIWHHYLDGGSPTHITDANCPHSAAWVKMSSKIWAIGDEVVPFCATNLPRNWTLSDDAGFLPTGLQQSGSLDALALGQYQKDLVVLFSDAAQIWVPDPDPALHSLKDIVEGVGTRYPRSVRKVSRDLFFLNDSGYRSISSVGRDGNLADVDVGSPIDSIVKPLLSGAIDPIAAYYAGGGQYWDAIGNEVHTYTFSRTMKISAWAKNTYGITIEDFAELDGTLYVRAGDDVYKVDDSVFTDDGALFEMIIEMPFLDFKKPGVLKQIVGVDAVVKGDVDLQLGWLDPDDGTTLLTDKVSLSGVTAPGDMTPIEATATAFAPLFTSTSDEEVQIDSITFYYEELGAQ